MRLIAKCIFKFLVIQAFYYFFPAQGINPFKTKNGRLMIDIGLFFYSIAMFPTMLITNPSACGIDCVICLQRVCGSGGLLHCGHIFHLKCLSKWALYDNTYANICAARISVRNGRGRDLKYKIRVSNQNPKAVDLLPAFFHNHEYSGLALVTEAIEAAGERMRQFEKDRLE